MFRALLQEIGFAGRALARSPWFAVTAILMLAAGLGLAMYMFGAINGFVLKPMPFMQADRLIYVGYEERGDPGDEQSIPLHDFVEMRAAQTSLEDLAGYYEGTVNLSDGDRPERHDGVYATAGVFSELGMSAHLGRVLQEADNVPGAAPVAVIGYALWMNRFNGDAGVIGRTVRINGIPSTVVGVMPPAFRFPRKHDVWVALSLDVGTARNASRQLEAFGRLREGATLAAARAEIEAQLTRINAAFPDITVADRALVKPLAERMISDQTRTVLYTMFAAVLLVLLIACANVANLMVARGAARQRELAIRGALGAGRRRLVIQVLAESLIIAVVAAGLGWLAAYLGGEFTMRAIMSSEDPPVYWVDFSLDRSGMIFCFTIALLSSIVAAVLPALDAARSSAAQAMRAGGAGSIGRGARLGKVLVVLQVAVCMALLVGSGLTVRSVLKMQDHDLGVDIDNVLTGRVALFAASYPTAVERGQFVTALQQRLEAVPGITSVTLATTLPTMDIGRFLFHVDGTEVPAGNDYPATWATWVTPGYFDTFRLAPLAGRVLTDQDRADGQRVVVVNESFARDAWPGRSPLGERVRINPTRAESQWATVVGLVPDTVQGGFDSEARAALFLPMAQEPGAFMSFAVRTAGDPYALSDAVRAAVQSVDADLPVYWLRSMRDWVEIALWDGRLLANLFGVFALFALLLAVSGIYAVLAYGVSQRTREIGVRRALGAGDPGILRMVLGQGGRQLVLGLSIGLMLSLAFGQVLASFLFEVQGFDPMTLVTVAIALALVSVVAGWIPARRALRVQPMVALRHD
jgi:putative ABC transport system permease protein